MTIVLRTKPLSCLIQYLVIKLDLDGGLFMSHSNKVMSLIVLSIFLFQTPKALAIFDLKVGYGTLASKPDLLGFYGGTATMPSAIPTVGLTLDAIVTIPLVGIGGGIRTEDMKIGYDSDVLGIDNSFKRTALILNYRLLNTLVYLGPIFTLGVNHSNQLKISSGGTELSKIKSSKVSSYSAGLEVGASLIGLMAGAEMGYMSMKYKDATDELNTTKVYDLDMSGSYIKLFVGFGI
jgi:hypothetical protein